MQAEAVFADLGFNAVEAQVYVALLQHGPQTAYRIGKIINRPTANVYKAVDVLAARGAVELEDGDTRICRAVPIESLTRQLEANYRGRLDVAAAALRTIAAPAQVEGITTLLSVDAVLQRAREMIGRCSATLVADCFPAPLALLAPDLRAAAARGREVLVQAYAETDIQGANVAVPAVGEATLAHWKAQQLNLVVDGREMLVALFNHEMTALIQANYSNNLYLSCVLYSGMKNEHQLLRVMAARDMDEFASLKRQLTFFVDSDVPGLSELYMRYQ